MHEQHHEHHHEHVEHHNHARLAHGMGCVCCSQTLELSQPSLQERNPITPAQLHEAMRLQEDDEIDPKTGKKKKKKNKIGALALAI